MSQHSAKALLKLINRLKEELKKDDVMKEICEKFDVDISEIDMIPVKVAPLDVSAKTDAGVITLNSSLFKKEKLDKILSLLLHETVHYFQQCDKPTKSANEGDYLSNPSELEAFQHQVEFLDDNSGKNKAEQYVDQVLDHHDKKGKERKDKKNKLMKLVE